MAAQCVCSNSHLALLTQCQTGRSSLLPSEVLCLNLVTVYLPYSGQEHTRRTIDQLKQSPLVETICLLATGGVSASLTAATGWWWIPFTAAAPCG